MKIRIYISLILLTACSIVGCKDDIVLPDNGLSQDSYAGEPVLLTSGTTESSITTRAPRTYYMPGGYRFVAKMYFKTQDSGTEEYDTARAHTAWLKVDDKGAGNSLYWKNTYPTTAQREDDYHNDEFAPIFYWQNRQEHAFLAWTDLNHVAPALENPWTGNGSNQLNFTSNLVNYAYHTGNKEWQWVEKSIVVRGEEVLLASEQDMVNQFKNVNKNQTEFKDEASKEIPAPDVDPYYWYSNDLENYCKVVQCNDEGQDKGPEDKTSPRHLMYFFKKKLEYAFPEGMDMASLHTQTIVMEGTEHEYVLDDNNNPVARIVNDGGEVKYYKCTTNCHIMYDESLSNDADYTVYIFRRNLKKENLEVVIDYPALGFDLSKGTKTSMAEQPDVAMALTIDKVPKSAVMETNRVHLYFKHQFAQVQVNIKNAVDNSVEIQPGQIDKVELLGVSNYGYVFAEMNRDGTIAAPKTKTVAYPSSTFKEVVATDYTEQQLRDNPYGTSFVMFDRTLTDEDELQHVIKSYECITYGRLQAIRITWHEDDVENSAGGTTPGVQHVATYRVDEKNDHNEPLRLLGQGKKYIWNMELRRGTLAVVRPEIVPWEENQETYSAEGFIVTNQSQQ